MSRSALLPFFATCPRGLEPVLVDELTALGAAQATPTGGGVSFQADWLTAAQANRLSRVASRILWRVGEARYRSEDDIYRAAAALPWGQWMDVDGTLRVDVSATGAQVKSLEFITLKVKDAVCDHFRRLTGRRPSVDTRRPDHRVWAYLDAQRVTFYLDTSGEALFKRGLRETTGEAPLRENLAAGLLNLSGWQARQDDGSCEPLFDPMCGSGTFLIEAAQMALGIDAGAARGFGFERLRNFPLQDWKDWVAERDRSRPAARPLPLFGSDADAAVLRHARHNLQAAGLADCVQLNKADVRDVQAPAPAGVWITNPPYGERLGEQDALLALYPQIGDVLKQHFSGWRAFFFTGDRRLEKAIRLSPSRRTVLYNGALECRLFEFRMVAGRPQRSRNEHVPPGEG